MPAIQRTSYKPPHANSDKHTLTKRNGPRVKIRSGRCYPVDGICRSNHAVRNSYEEAPSEDQGINRVGHWGCVPIQTISRSPNKASNARGCVARVIYQEAAIPEGCTPLPMSGP